MISLNFSFTPYEIFMNFFLFVHIHQKKNLKKKINLAPPPFFFLNKFIFYNKNDRFKYLLLFSDILEQGWIQRRNFGGVQTVSQ